MKLIGLLVLLGLVSLVEGEVMESFAGPCYKSFMNKVHPTLLKDQNNKDRYKQICQKYKNVYRYATLYDTGNRIPVYSAYRYKGYEVVKKQRGWMIEPQLDLQRESQDWENMTEMTPKGSKTHNGKWGKYQALDIDYSKQLVSGQYQRGHLYPHCHNCDPDLAESTFTLTNAAPQDAEDNTDWYGQVEKVTANIIHNECQEPAHVVTGVVPGERWIGYDGTNRVNVPSYFWSAFCCKHTNQYHSGGFLAAINNPGRKMVADRVSVERLNRNLSDLYTFHDFKVFGDMCK